MSTEALHVAVTIATRGRPDGCRRLVEALLVQQIPDSWCLRIVVVDNDPDGSDLELAADARVHLVEEQEPGIPFARNRGLEEALPWADVIVFIDDDEVPTDGWLHRLVNGLDRYDADVTVGPVESVFPTDTPDWVRRNPVFQRRRRPAGALLVEAPTGNTAVRSDVFADGLRFSPGFRGSGGEDTHLFRQAYRAGARIRWVADAVVNEFVPPDRARFRWVLARSFRIGANRIQFLRAGPASTLSLLKVVAGSGVEILLGVVAPIIAIGSRRFGLVLLGRASRGVGAYAALIGVRYAAYK